LPKQAPREETDQTKKGQKTDVDDSTSFLVTANELRQRKMERRQSRKSRRARAEVNKATLQAGQNKDR
jgi:hypothetical protein